MTTDPFGAVPRHDADDERSDHGNEDHEQAERVLRWILRERPTEFRRWQIHKDVRNHGRFQRLEDLDRPLDRLVKHRFIRVQATALRSGPGRPPEPVYEVNPEILTPSGIAEKFPSGPPP